MPSRSCDEDSRIGRGQRFLFFAILAEQLALFGSARVARPRLDSDAATGLWVWESMHRGAGFNRLLLPDPADISRNVGIFLTWWSPGQYLAVGPLHSLGADWGLAIAIATLLGALLGIAGYWSLYRSLGFSAKICAWSAGFLSFCWFTIRLYYEFHGGELVAFGLFPWLILGISRLRLRPFHLTALLSFGGIYLVGGLAKLSFAVAALAALAGVAAREVRPGARLGSWLQTGAAAAAMAAFGYGLLWLVFLRHGPTPASPSGPGSPWTSAIPVAIFLPMGSVFGLFGVISRIFLFPGHPLVDRPEALLPVFWLLAAGTVVLAWALSRRVRLPEGFGPFALAMAGTTSVLLGTFFIMGSPVSWEDRHAFAAGAVILPGIVALALSGTARIWRILAGTALVLGVGYGVASAGIHVRDLRRLSNVGRSGITQHAISADALRALQALDDQAPPSTLVYLPSPEIALELRRVRALPTSDLFLRGDVLRQAIRHGRVPLLVLLTNPDLENDGRADIIRRSFADYSPGAWRRRVVGGWTFSYQGVWPPGPER
jgi:hypothetical protein